MRRVTSDSDGFEKDKPRFIWNYRDWVINAFNRNLPYDQFVIEQLAGDQLPNPARPKWSRPVFFAIR